MWILYCILAFIAVLLLVILIRTLCFKPEAQPQISSEEVSFDKESSVDALARLIRCKTVSYLDSSLEDDAEFEKLINLLPELYPEVFAACEFKKLPDRALLFKWTGKQHEKPTVLMAHYDVVPADEEYWEKPPFDAVIEDGVLWGRGSLDTKVTFNGILFSANTLIKQGYTPENDIYFAFSGGEEINGNGAVNIVNYFKENNITPDLVVDEGGAVVENVFPGVKKLCAMIGIAEKGLLNLTFSVKSNGGHASSPAPHTPIGVLSKACCRVENKPFKMHITKPAAEMFNTLGRHSNFLFRMIFANLWLFKGVINMICKKSGGELNALVRTTVAFTQSEGSSVPNVIPPKATMTANLRLNHKDTVESAVERIRKTIKDDSIELTVGNNMQPSRISQTNCEAFDRVASAVTATWKDCLVSPYLMVQCSDSRHYGVISDKVYRFSAMDLTSEERKTIHGHNEKIRLETAHRAVEFYIRLMKNC